MIKKYYRQMIALFFTSLGLFFRYQGLANRTLWADEVNQYHHTVGAFKSIWIPLPNGELTCFWGDYLITWPFAQMFGMNKWALNIPHIIATLLGFYFLYLICQRHLKTALGWLITWAVVCFNAELIFHAFELRPYAVLPTISLGAFYFSQMLIQRPDHYSRWQKILIGFFYVFSVFYHAWGIVIIFFCSLYWFLVELEHKSIQHVLKDVWPFFGIFSVIAIPLFWWYFTGYPEFDQMQSRARGIQVFEYIPNPVVDMVGFLKGVFGNLVGFKPFYVFLAGLAGAFILPHKDRFKQIGFFLVMVVIPIILKMYSDMGKGYWFLQRQFIWITPIFAYYLGWCCETSVSFIQNKLNLSGSNPYDCT